MTQHQRGSLVSGAGGGSVNDAKGSIIFCVSIANGFVIYCEKNIVGAKYTGNENFPYTIVEIPNSGGVQMPNQVSWQNNSDTHYAWTNQGMQSVSLTGGASNVFPEVTEFLAGRLYEDFDESTLTLTSTNLTSALTVRLTLIANQYVVISYGPQDANPPLAYSLVLDLNRQRWGKLKIPHCCAFQWNSPGNNYELTYAGLHPNAYSYWLGYSYEDLTQFGQGPQDQVNKVMAFMQQDGTIYIANFNLSETTADGVLLLGKYQLQRNRGVSHQTTDVESVASTLPFSMYVIPTYDGKTLMTPIPGVLISEGPLTRKYGKRVVCLNYSLLFIGAFNMTSVITDLKIEGEIQ